MQFWRAKDERSVGLAHDRENPDRITRATAHRGRSSGALRRPTADWVHVALGGVGGALRGVDRLGP
jgi:hypothetical protein